MSLSSDFCNSRHYNLCSEYYVKKVKICSYDGADFYVCEYWGGDVAHRDWAWNGCGGI